MTNLIKIRENTKKRNEENNLKNYKIPSGTFLITKMLKEQNIRFIIILSEYMGISEEEKRDLLNKFVKINYICPKIVSHNKYLKNIDLKK